MAYRRENDELVIDGWEGGIAHSPYTGIAKIANLNSQYYPGVAYVNYRRQAATLSSTGVTEWYAGAHSTNVSNNFGWQFTVNPNGMGNPVQHCTSPAGLNYVLDSNGQVWKQSAVNSSTFNLLGNGGRTNFGSSGIAFWNNYLVVFGNNSIEFCGDGTGDSGVTGLNWNITKPTSTVNVQVSNTALSSYVWTSGPTAGSTSATLNSSWTGLTGNYYVQFSDAETRTCSFTNGSTTVTWTGGLTNTVNTTIIMYQMYVTSGTFSGYQGFSSGQAVQFSTTGSLPTGLSIGTTYYLLSNVDLSGVTRFTVSTSVGGSFIPFTDTGSGTITMSFLPASVPPIENTTVTNITWGTSGTGSTSFTLSSVWQGATGQYNFVDSKGNQMLSTFTYNSNSVSLLSPAVVQDATNATYQVNILNPSTTVYRAYVSKADGNLYFTNGRYMGRILAENQNTSFIPGIPATYTVDYGTFSVLDPNDSILDMTDLLSTMIIAGQNKIYTWDYVSPSTTSPVPIGEPISRIINLLNNVYVFAGQKGNIYTSNGSYAQVLAKIPDYIAGVIDPVWTYGGVMTHRGKIYFQAMAKDTSGNYILSGIFSAIVSPSVLGEVASGIVMEAQNSFGLVPSTGATGAGILIDNEPSSNGQDSYYSAWSNGASTGGIDYNDTSLWQNFEPTIETDIIPIGTFLDKKTPMQVQFKLDRPMVSGDQIRIYGRGSLSDAYTLIGTVTDTVLGANLPSNLSQLQWLQFKVQMKCASSGSSFIPIREIRVQLQ